METGIVHNDGFSQLLRTLAQRRRQGCLEVALPDGKILISFVTGRIVEVVKNDLSPVVEVWTMLSQAGYFHGELEAGWEGSYSELLAQSNVSELLTSEMLKSAVSVRILNHLYALERVPTGLFAFQSQMVDYDVDYCPSISVGQLLLDLVQLETDNEKFLSLFPEGNMISAIHGEISASMNVEEGVVFDLVQAPVSLESLRNSAILSEYSLREALLKLHERGLIEVVEPAPTNSDLLTSDLLSQLDSTIDSAFLEGERIASEASLSTASPEMQIQPNSELVEATSERAYKTFAKITELNARLLNSEIVPQAILLGFLMCSILVPFFFWGRTLTVFGH